MTWYTLTLIIASALLVLQVVLALILGDADFDFDSEFDFGDIISIKGLIHFIIGLTLTLTLFDTHTTFIWILAVFVGLIFLVGFGFLYKKLYKNLKQELKYETNIDKQGIIQYWNGTNGEISIVLENALRNMPCSSDEQINLTAGDVVRVTGTRDNLKIAQL